LISKGIDILLVYQVQYAPQIKPTMKPTRIIIEKLPKSSWYKEPSILIAAVALITTIISLYWTREQYVKSTRPFLWVTNCPDTIGHTMPHLISIKVLNAPARIRHLEYGQNVPLTGINGVYVADENKILYPDAQSEWETGYIHKGYNQIISFPDSIKTILWRYVKIEYTSLNGRKRYHYQLKQYYRFTPGFPRYDTWQNFGGNEGLFAD
jgi:hypothetical protein